MNTIYDEISKCGIVPVVAIDDASQAIGLAKALLKGGINSIEITLRTDAAISAIAAISKEFPDMIVGAGTVLDEKSVDMACEAGAKFIVSPGSNANVIKYCIDKGVVIIPGVATPSEVEYVRGFGLNILKLFPAEAIGGTKLIKALAAPYRDIKFMPTGGINANNIEEYLTLKSVIACGGSWMVKSELINPEGFDKITELSAEAMEIVKKVRGDING